ncbi:MAG: hypothetical protein KC422_18225 [Trueperaceae bacterium]|nr:hypothetical protein [Trueperaceae bacterium]
MFFANLKQKLSKQLPFILFEFLFLNITCLLVFIASFEIDKSRFLGLGLLYLMAITIFFSELIKANTAAKSASKVELESH